ncbi:MAG TPA: HD domain-containing phosphohydrolase [Longimicrobiaceae bacterium]|nr:HD domain-containing phosphohydrolase [Longimicrobiaceae bacterium]
MSVDSSGVRSSELVAALSLATDLGMGQPMEHQQRVCILAVRLGRAFGLGEPELTEVYHLALLRWIGCTSHAFELSAWFDDEIAAQARAATFELQRPADLLRDLVLYAGAGRSPLRRIHTVVSALAAGPGSVADLLLASCEVGRRLAVQLGFGAEVGEALGYVFERWDGRGPAGARGETIPLAVRVVQVAGDAETFRRIGGLGAAREVVRERMGAAYDPTVAELFCRECGALCADLEVGEPWEAVLAAEPGGPRVLTEAELDSGLLAVADFADLKSPCTAGHSRGVAHLAAEAARAAGLPEADVVALYRAGLLHDVGRVGVPSGIWEKPGPLSEAEWERVRLHPYYTERVLSRVRALAQVGGLAALHHERMDGSGYPHRVPAAMLPLAARILAAADVYQAMTQPRPHRQALGAARAAAELRQEARDGRLEPRAVDAVLTAAGAAPQTARRNPVDLTPREVEVLRLVARGLSMKKMAQRLGISRKTVDHHIQHIYAKAGVSSRAAAALFAIQHGFLDPPDAPSA